MSSMEKERVFEKKREGPSSSGRPKVFESKKEKKKRRLILNDSESDEEKYLISHCQKVLAVPADDPNGNSSPIKQKDIIEEIKVESIRALKSEAVKQREDAASDKKAPAVSGADQNGNVSPIMKKNSIDRLSIEEDIKVESKRALRSEVVMQREEADSDKNVPAVSGADQNRNGSPIKRKKGVYKLTSIEEIKVKSKRVLRSEVVKHREESDSKKKKVTESRPDRKRSTETVDAETRVKKFKSESVKSGREQTKQSGEKTVKRVFLKQGDKRSDIRADRVLGSKPVVSAGSQRDNSTEKRSQGSLKEINKHEDEIVQLIERSGQRPLRKLKDDMIPSVDVKREEVGISKSKGIRVQGKGGVLRVLSSNKKVGGLEEVHIQREEENMKSTMKHPSLSRERKVIEKSSSTVNLDKNQLNQGNVSSAERGRPCKEKTEPEISSPKIKSKSVDVSNRKTNFYAKGGSKSKSKASLLTKQNTKETSEGRSTIKQKIREQIKKILLDAGWKIELRPRKGRDYEDAVYVSPLGGSGYWSITKAYAVYLDQCNSELGDKSKDLSGKSSKKSTRSDKSHEGTSSTFAAIPMDLLSMLKRNVVNKRRRRKELDETQKKLGVSNKGKGTNKIKDSKNKHFKDNGGVRERKKPNNALGVVGSTAQKLHLRGKNKKQRGCALLVRGANQEAETDIDDYVPYVWKRTVLSWMIDMGVVRANGKVKYMNKRQTRTILEGWITRDGIRCGCCSKVITVSKFEIHAGSKLCQPYQNIFVEEAGISLLQCQLNAWEKQESGRQGFYNIDIDGDDPNDDTCGICGDGGDLICCDGCPSTFHLNCLDIQMLPPGDWHCMNCSCRFCGLVSDVASEGSGLTISPLLTCSQCEKKYHQECIPEADAISVGSNDSDTSFCGESCKKVFKQLQKLLGIKNDLEAGLSWSLIRCFDEDSSGLPCSLPQRAECNSKLAVALAIMDECFLPIIHQRSGINLIHNVVYNCGSNINRLSYSGFYTFILERGDEIISAASVRIHGTRLAEMPFIGTRNMYRRQGMCRRLLNGIELALYSLNIEKLIIPAISELTETWTSIFGFKPLELSQKQEVRSINMLVFPGTGLLQKPILKKDSAEQHTIANGAEQRELVIKHHCRLKAASESFVLSSVWPNPCGSDEVVVHPKHEVNDVKLILPTNESSDAPHGSECQDPDCKSSVTAADMDLLVQPKAVYHDEPLGEETLQINSSDGPKIEVPCEGTLHENHEAKNEDAAVASSLFVVNDTSVRHATIIKHHNTLKAANVSSVLSSVRPNPCSFDEVVVHPIHEVNDVELILPTNESSDARGSECQVPDCSSSETAADGDLLEVVYHNEPAGEDTFQVNSSSEAKIEAPREGAVHGNHEAKNEDAAVASSLYILDDGSVRRATEDRCTSPVATASTLRVSRAKTAPPLLATDDTLMQHSSDGYCTSPGVNISTLQDSGGNSLHIPVCFLECSSNATQHSKSEATSKSSSPSLIEHGFLAASELIVDENHDRDDKFTLLQPELKLFGDNLGHNDSDRIIGPVDPVEKKFLATSVKSNVHAVGEGTATNIHEVKAEVVGVKHEANANDEDGEPYTSRVIDRRLDIAPGQESQACESSLTPYSGTITEPISGFQVP